MFSKFYLYGWKREEQCGWRRDGGQVLANSSLLLTDMILYMCIWLQGWQRGPFVVAQLWLAFFFLSLARYFDDWKRWRRDNAVGGWDGGQVLTNSSLFLTDMIGCQLWWIPNKMISVFSQFSYIYSLLQKFGLTFAFFYWLYTCIYTVSETKGPAVN